MLLKNLSSTNALRALVLRGLLPAALMLGAVSACSRSGDQSSQPLVTDVSHSAIKNQSIGNCWLYAAAGWAESLHKTATGQEVDLSESYWTWWYFYDQLVSGSQMTEIQTGGWWNTSNNLIKNHGYLFEGEFLPDEDGLARSERQKKAVTHINEQLKDGGALSTPAQRTPENVRAQLDLAFGSDMAAAELVARDAKSLAVGKRADGSLLTLLDVTGGSFQYGWRSLSYPANYGEGTAVSPQQELQRKNVLQRVMKALNDKQPVVMSVMIDFNAWDKTTGMFNMATLEAAGEAGRQGGHMVVLEDYVVDNVPGIGSIEEGDVSDDLKAAALKGDLRYLVAKNSWSDSVTEGYHRFHIGYLNAQHGWKRANGTDVDHYTTLKTFILPPGY